MSGKTFKVTTMKSHNFSIQDISDLICTALEGGINYWCGKAEKVWDDDGNYSGVSESNQSNVHYASDLIGLGGKLMLYDVDYDETEEKWELDLEKVLKGIQMHCEEHNIAPSDLMDNHDADDADSIVQFALFGEIVYC